MSLSTELNRNKRVKVVCTLGPSTKSVEQLTKLIQSGMDVARLNFSHGNHAYHKELIQNVRAASKITGKPITLLQDLQGPKLRAGTLPGGSMDLIQGEQLLLHPEGSTPTTDLKGKRALPISAEIAGSIAKDVRTQSKILFDDGKIQTRVLKVQGAEILVEVEVAGKLSNHKGMNLPGTPLSLSCLTAKDLEDLKFGIDQDVDAIALSFVRSAADMDHLRELIKKQSNEVPILVSKIEREEAIDTFESVIEASDALLIARGDMAVEIGPWRVPGVQKKLIQACNQVGVPVITATQMLESMIQSPTPTRAEASDVANAVFDGTDAVMLSAETASGQYPIETVDTMVRIILEAENYHTHRHPSDDLVHLTRSARTVPGMIVDSVAASAASIAEQVGAVAIACLTHSGNAARTLSKFRPRCSLIAIVDNERMRRRLGVVWGIQTIQIPKIAGTDDVFQMVEGVLQQNNFAQAQDLVVITAGVPTLRKGTTNTIKVHRVGAAHERSPLVNSE